MSNLSKFRDLGLSDNMIEALRKKGFEEPTPIQALTIPFLLSGTKDIFNKRLGARLLLPFNTAS